MKDAPQDIGVLGLGIIGGRVAGHLRAAGHRVQVWSRTGKAGSLASPRAVAEAAKVLQIFVRDSAALLEAMRDLAPVLTPEHLVLNHATVSKAAVLEAARLCAESGAGFLDAPFTGSKMAAQNAKLVYYVGGDAALLERARPVLELSSVKILPLGGVGDAMVLKIVTNLVTAVTVKALAEAAAITRAEGVPLAALQTALEANANHSPLLAMKLPALMQDDFEPHFALINMLKDADFARELAGGAGLLTPALDCTAAALRTAAEAGLGDLDFSVIGRLPS
jgi:3-hydroxyisobutyrate dehydrogenase-like beta-hydroxyacid dehydrogenase